MTSSDIDALPPEAADLARRLARGELLGATRNLVAIGSMLAAIAANGTSPDTLASVIGYFHRTRGQETCAVANGLALLAADLPSDEPGPILERRADWFETASRRWNDVIAAAAREIIPVGATVVAFDYSSVVAAVLRQGQDHARWRIVIPESRPLGGGRPFVEELGPNRIARFVSDAALARTIRDADVVLIGAETVFADGSCHNTVGSLTAAICADHLEVPLFVATPLLKFAPAEDLPAPESAGVRDFGDLVGPLPWVLTMQPENERVPPGLIRAYLTEQGMVAPDGFKSEAVAAFRAFRRELAEL
jgi:hypothetical protein